VLVSASRRNRLLLGELHLRRRIVEKSAIARRNRQYAGRARYPDLSEQIWAVLFCTLNRLLSPPLCDLSVISGKQDVRNFPAVKFGRPRVLRRFKQTTGETIISSGLVMT
jgi:hypothetical protein